VQTLYAGMNAILHLRFRSHITITASEASRLHYTPKLLGPRPWAERMVWSVNWILPMCRYWILRPEQPESKSPDANEGVQPFDTPVVASLSLSGCRARLQNAPCQHTHASDSLSRHYGRFRPIVVFLCDFLTSAMGRQYRPAHLTCI
jgi:hypothetical protein